MVSFKLVKAKVEVSARHLHLTKEAVEKLFGKGYRLRKLKDISQTGQFATRETLEVRGPKGKFEQVRIVGPERDRSQFELSITDCRQLGIKPALHISGEVKGAPFVKVKGPKGEIKVPAIVAWRHLHISTRKAKELGLANRQFIKVRVGGERGVVFERVVVRVHPTFKLRLHLDTDEGNACGAGKSTQAELIF